MSKGNHKKTYAPEPEVSSSKAAAVEDPIVGGLDEKYDDSVQKLIDIGKENLLVSTDMLIEGPHFDLGYMPLQHLGYKAVAVKKKIGEPATRNGYHYLTAKI